jgi:hypothetical protein
MEAKAWDNYKVVVEHRPIANKYAGRACLLYTLDGTKDANICGRLNKYATIKALDGTMSIEVTWPLVERKMEGDKTFYAC